MQDQYWYQWVFLKKNPCNCRYVYSKMVMMHPYWRVKSLDKHVDEVHLVNTVKKGPVQDNKRSSWVSHPYGPRYLFCTFHLCFKWLVIDIKMASIQRIVWVWMELLTHALFISDILKWQSKHEGYIILPFKVLYLKTIRYKLFTCSVWDSVSHSLQ